MISKRCERSPCHVPAILARCQSPEQDPAPNRARPLTGKCYWAAGPRLQPWAGPCLAFFFFFKFRQVFKCCGSESAKGCSLHDSISVKDHRKDVALLALPSRNLPSRRSPGVEPAHALERPEDGGGNRRTFFQIRGSQKPLRAFVTNFRSSLDFRRHFRVKDPEPKHR